MKHFGPQINFSEPSPLQQAKITKLENINAELLEALRDMFRAADEIAVEFIENKRATD